MTEADYQCWLSMLGRTHTQKIAAVRDLLRHAIGDEMTKADRVLCLRALHELGTTYVAEKEGAYKTHHSSRKFFHAEVVDTDDRLFP